MGNIVLPIDAKRVSDGHHTFAELYEHRHLLAVLFLNAQNIRAWKAKVHADGTMFEDSFIAGAYLPSGQISYHFPMKYWLMLDIPEQDCAPTYDGYNSNDVAERLTALIEGAY